MATLKIDALEVPKVYVQETGRESISDTGRTAGRKLRRDTLGPPKRSWDFRTRAIPYATAQAIEDYLDSIDWGEVEIWLDEWGNEANTVTAMIDEDSWRNE